MHGRCYGKKEVFIHHALKIGESLSCLPFSLICYCTEDLFAVFLLVSHFSNISDAGQSPEPLHRTVLIMTPCVKWSRYWKDRRKSGFSCGVTSLPAAQQSEVHQGFSLLSLSCCVSLLNAPNPFSLIRRNKRVEKNPPIAYVPHSFSPSSLLLFRNDQVSSFMSLSVCFILLR